MCGRFWLDFIDAEIDALCLEAEEASKIVIPRENEVCPTNVVPVIVRRGEGRETHAMVWGYPKWNQPGVVFNARSETALEKPMFAKSLRERPAVIPTSGFFEWQKVAGKSKKDKYRFKAPGDSITWLAGFWNRFAEKDGPVPERFVLLTTDANQGMIPYHDRMPVTLAREEIAGWLSGESLGRVLERVPLKLDIVPAG